MRRPDPYPMMRQFARPALAQSSAVRVVAVVLGFEIAFQLTPFIFDPDARGPVGPLDTVLELSAFALPLLVVVVLVRLLHRRGWDSLTGPSHLAWPAMRVSFLWVAAMLLLLEPLRLIPEWDYLTEMRDPGQWAVMLPLGLAALLIQVGTEEVVYRGYLQQELAARTRSRLVWMVLPSLWFGLAHVGNGSTFGESALWMFWASLLGLACADLTARVGHIGPAVGLHLANNCFALFVVGVKDQPVSGLALFLYPAHSGFDMPPITPAVAVSEILFSILSIGIMWLAARIAIRA